MAVKLDPAILVHPDGSLEVLEVSLVNCPDDDPHRLPGSEGECVTAFVQKQRPLRIVPTPPEAEDD